MISDPPITMLTLLSEVHVHCEANDLFSLKSVHHLFDSAVRCCTRPTARSNPSFEFFGDWVARTAGLVQCIDGRYQRLSLDCWHTISQLHPDDHEA